MYPHSAAGAVSLSSRARALTEAWSNMKMRRAFAKSFQYDTALLSLQLLVVVVVVVVVLSAPVVVFTLVV